SSHLLNEVEQLCTRIAVLNQGKKVFEGPLADARTTQSWVRLKTADFDAATKLLRGEQLIRDVRDGALVTLADGVGTDRIVKRLVEAGMPVFEVVQEEQTLEGFYLSLMQESRAASPASRPHPSPAA
ncbi:MAG: ABC transporter ATP-binding protein, partial [Verrucomicrobia bacterium]|nr:ABC transporter ATP-binding protein [Verrucomicrobiota bacterium]